MRDTFESLRNFALAFLVVAHLVSSQTTLPYQATGSCYSGDCSGNNVINVVNALQQTVYKLEVMVQQLQKQVSSLQSCCNFPASGTTIASPTPPTGIVPFCSLVKAVAKDALCISKELLVKMHFTPNVRDWGIK